ncbi:Gfo/Idh/MocA family protein [Candidatus Poribacteria bacterium]
MDKPFTIALVGLSGYGSNHVNRFLDASEDQNIQIVAAVDVNPDRCRRLQELKDAGAKLYSSLDEFYGSIGRADLVVIATPIHFHAPQTIQALGNGSSVLCEKPATATVQDAIRMAEAADEAGKFVAIGYQWSFSKTIQAVKRDVMDGVFGKPICLKSFMSWPRPASYYTQRHWAAKIKSEDGDWILDSPVHNATAHYLHNCFYILGKTTETSAAPADVQAELYRANPIENYDTAVLRAHTEDGVEILHFVSHVVPSDIGPVVSYKFEEATLTHERSGSNVFVARFKDGSIKNYGSPDDGGSEKCWSTVAAAREGKQPLCDVRAAMSELLCVNGAQESSEVVNFPDSLIRKQGPDENPQTIVNGLQAILVQCFSEGILPHEHGGVQWSRESEVISLKDYEHFPARSTE